MAAVNIKIDFDKQIPFDEISTDLRVSKFQSALSDGSAVDLSVEISAEAHELIPNVYNLAFGPKDHRGRINDSIQLSHTDYSAVFSTILLAGLTYLTDHPDHFLGVDGSNDQRAFLYWRYLQTNYNYLNQYFEFKALKYYVRISRFGKVQYADPFDFNDIYVDAVPVLQTPFWPKPMYNYFIFTLRPDAPNL